MGAAGKLRLLASIALAFALASCGSVDAGGRTSGTPFSAAIFVTGNPNNRVQAPKGTIGVDGTSGAVYQNTNGSKAWAAFAASSGAGVGDIDSIAAGDGLTSDCASGDCELDVVCGLGLSCAADELDLRSDCITGDTLILDPLGEGANEWQCAHDVDGAYKLIRYVVATNNGGLQVTMDYTDTTANAAFVNLRDDCSNGDVLVSGASGDTWSCSTPTGAYLGRQIFTASGTYTPTSGTKRVRVRMVGGGGGGAGAARASGQAGAGGGGGSGVYWEKYIDPGATVTGGAATVGQKGAGGNAGANDGSNGTDTSIVINGTTYTAKGGFGGSQGNATATSNAANGGYQGSTAGSTSGADFMTASPGEAGLVFNGAGGAGGGRSGNGGGNPLGGGGRGQANAEGKNNAPANGKGGGGGGALAGATNTAGGDGTDGVIIIEEFN